ncbi:hypothetical protein M0813_04540 [Anaeramoeba flamelloides]|uniref:PSI domain-containing protein n=1 Tax=Anaeramoeba flamelloides TaxID=1746091 RepID=A0ABQ8XJE3_9EUKA|nr:hypothetical protein M0813_04540 [Anaeramoeba flamelloides]
MKLFKFALLLIFLSNLPFIFSTNLIDQQTKELDSECSSYNGSCELCLTHFSDRSCGWCADSKLTILCLKGNSEGPTNTTCTKGWYYGTNSKCPPSPTNPPTPTPKPTVTASPSPSALPHSDCRKFYNNCMTCIEHYMDRKCGWCFTTSQCSYGDFNGPSDHSCEFSAWNWGPIARCNLPSPSHSPTTSPSPIISPTPSHMPSTSASQSPSSSPSHSHKSKGLSSGKIAGITVGSVCGFFILIILIIYLVRRNKKQEKYTKIKDIQGSNQTGSIKYDDDLSTDSQSYWEEGNQNKDEDQEDNVKNDKKIN